MIKRMSWVRSGGGLGGKAIKVLPQLPAAPAPPQRAFCPSIHSSPAHRISACCASHPEKMYQKCHTMSKECHKCDKHRQHCRLSICENWLSWTNTETAAATPPTVMQNLLRASAQWLVLESAVFWLISPPTWVNWHMKMFLVHFTHYSGAERGNFVRNLWILSYILSLKFGEALLLVRTEYWTNESFAPNLRSQWHIPQIWGEAPIGWILCADQ